MADIIIPTIAIFGAFFAACLTIIGAFGILRLTGTQRDGVMHHFFYALLISNALIVMMSSRNFEIAGAAIETETLSNPLASWAIRLTSVLALAASTDLMIRRLRLNKQLNVERLALGGSIVLLWIGNILLPSFLSTHKTPLQLNWIYTPILLMGLICLTHDASLKCLIYARNAIALFCVASLLCVAIRPDLVLDLSYSQGYFPGVPRFAGLTPHAVVMGMLACIGIWLLLAFPLHSRKIQWLSIIICGVAVVLSQAKGAWITLIFSIPVLYMARHRIPNFTQVSQSRHRDWIVASALLVGLLLVTSFAYLTSGSIGNKIFSFLASDEGAQIMSMTGRDRIWDVALDEWHKSPVFGYGLPLFGVEHQIQIHMLFATHGHNQLIDTLGRTGLFGATTLVIYTFILVYLSLLYTRQTRGLSTVLMLGLLFRMISEVPLTLANISPDGLTHYLLLVTIASCIAHPKERQLRTG